MNQPPLPFWGISATEMLQHLHTAKDGLTADEAKQRLARYGSNLLKPPKRSDLFTLLLRQFNMRASGWPGSAASAARRRISWRGPHKSLDPNVLTLGVPIPEEMPFIAPEVQRAERWLALAGLLGLAAVPVAGLWRWKRRLGPERLKGDRARGIRPTRESRLKKPKLQRPR